MAGLSKLSVEILEEILDHIESDPQKCVAIDRRDHLSVESFRPPSPPPISQATNIGNFRLTCRRFSKVGAPYQFTKVSLRFSLSGFRRLDAISGIAGLAQHTKKFSYLVPPFYGIRDLPTGDVRPIHHGASTQTSSSAPSIAAEQRTILQSGEDVRILRKAMVAFRSLQHVQLLRLVESHAFDIPPFLEAHWSLACTHAINTMGDALLHARSPCSRFSGPMMNPQSILAVKERIQRDISSHVISLTCLELHFDFGQDLRLKILELSDSFRLVLSAASNLHALHIGFPSRFPLDLPLEQIFHNVQWHKLRAFGIQAWRLNEAEIIDLARRHAKTLRGLRLRDVHLKNGSRWKHILSMLRAEMEDLEWVSLRRIDYEDHFDEVWSGGVEVPDELPGGASDSGDEADFPGPFTDIGIEQGDSEEESDAGSSDDSGSSDEESIADTDRGPDAEEIALLVNTPTLLPSCTCAGHGLPATADDLGDDGMLVTYRQRKLWEKWVVRKCPEHGEVTRRQAA